MGLTVRHVTPGLGAIPRDLASEACSGLVGVALGIAEAQTGNGHRAQLLGWNPEPGAYTWNIGAVEAYSTQGWNWAKLGGYDFRITAPMIAMSSRFEHADVMHAYADPHLILSLRSGIRLFHLQTPVPEQPSRTYSYLASRADAVLSCSEYMRRQFLERVDYPAERVFHVSNGIDVRRFEDPQPNRVRRDLGIDSEVPIVLFAGALVPEKGLLQLLRAAAALHKQYEFQIVVAGTSALWLTPDQHANNAEDHYTRLVREAAEGLPVTWLGDVSVAKMPGVYAAADMFVAPSTWDEPFGMVACEAMAAGKPVIASRRGGLPEIVTDGETGLLVPSEDIEALRSALETLLVDRALARLMGQRAKVRSKLFSWATVAAKLDSIYHELGAPAAAHESRTPGSYAG